MRIRKAWLGALAAALWVAGCGGGGGSDATSSVSYSELVVFGDSLSDSGTYRVGTIAALGGGKFTVNGASSMIWTELLASVLGLDAPCPAQTGFSPIAPGLVGGAVTDVPACRSYAQGSARVANPAGPNSIAVQMVAPSAAPLGLSAMPLLNQMNLHLARVTSYSGKELVAVLAGGNDLFMQVNAVANAAGGGATAVGAAALAGWSVAEQGAVAAGGLAAVQAAATTAVTQMGVAGATLAGQIQALVLAKGAKRVVVVNLPDVSKTPYAQEQDASTQALINLMVTTFNDQLKAGLAGASGVLLVDAYTESVAQFNNPANYGLANVGTRACDPTSPANPLAGSSLACTAASTVAGDTSKYLFADDVHPTPYGSRLIYQLVSVQMAKAGWL